MITEQDREALISAIKKEDLQQLKLICENNNENIDSFLDSPVDEWCPPFFLAANIDSDNTEILAYFLQLKAELVTQPWHFVNEDDDESISCQPIHYAIYYNSPLSKIKYLIAQGADLSASATFYVERGDSAVEFAIAMNPYENNLNNSARHSSIVQYLIEQSDNKNKIAFLKKLVYWAVIYEKLDIFKFLLGLNSGIATSALLNSKYKDVSLAYLAITEGALEIVEYLIQHYPHTFLQPTYKSSLLTEILYQFSIDDRNEVYERYVNLIKKIIEIGWPINISEMAFNFKEDSTIPYSPPPQSLLPALIYYFLRCKHRLDSSKMKSLVKWSLEKGADINLVDCLGATMFMQAIEVIDEEILSVMLEYQHEHQRQIVHIDRKNSSTLLMYALKNPKLSLTTFINIINDGKNSFPNYVNLKDSSGNSALSYILQGKLARDNPLKNQLIMLLLYHGASSDIEMVDGARNWIKLFILCFLEKTVFDWLPEQCNLLIFSLFPEITDTYQDMCSDWSKVIEQVEGTSSQLVAANLCSSSSNGSSFSSSSSSSNASLDASFFRKRKSSEHGHGTTIKNPNTERSLKRYRRFS